MSNTLKISLARVYKEIGDLKIECISQAIHPDKGPTDITTFSKDENSIKEQLAEIIREGYTDIAFKIAGPDVKPTGEVWFKNYELAS